MIPEQRKMVARLSEEPFTLLGIDRDTMSRSALKASYKNNGITWPQIVEDPEDSLSARWNVTGFPTQYVLDHQGVIRLKGFLSEQQIEEKVEELLHEVPRRAR